MFRKQRAWINISLDDRVVYLGGANETTLETSNRNNSDSALVQGSLLRGHVNFRAATGCSFRSLRVALVGTLQTPAISSLQGETRDHGLPAQRQTNLQHEVDVLMGRSPHFEAGIHRLPFAILLPSDLQPSFRCPYGRQEYSVSVTAEEVHGRATTSKSQTVNLLSAGDSYNSASPFLDASTYTDSLGHVSVTMQSSIPSVGAQALLQLDIPSPKPDISLIGITVSLVQTVQVHAGALTSITRSSERQLFRLHTPNGSRNSATGEVLHAPEWGPGQPLSATTTVRLPTHETFAPSSTASKSRCRIMAANDSGHLLPPYSPEKPVEAKATTDWPAATVGEECACFTATDTVQQHIALELPRAIPVKL
ncbi:hypothetical protein P389DRAFT_187923 [Cystobasidium minutum MCA 4210]|uniref:uncharacterized protein n=1 Tax=Cystobasidium minutum MCA 4210 TaxID=1397322 RepID=UPI0034CF9720|eukprot:jgi/Rhomi1/187923/estExt_fgenesh1_pg.C_2_t10181